MWKYVTTTLVCALLSTGALAETTQGHQVTLSPDLYKTLEDTQAMDDAIEGLNIAVEYYWRVVGGKELSDKIKKVITELDPHSAQMSAKEFKMLQEEGRGEFGGVGVEIIKSHDPHRRGVIVRKLLPDSAAGKAGVKAGDTIIAINGSKTYTMSLGDAVTIMRDAVGTPLTLTVRRMGSPQPLSFTFNRSKVVVVPFIKHEFKNGYGYLRMITFSDRSKPDFVAELQKFEHESVEKHQPLKGLIFDLRNNTGGLVDAAGGMLQLLLEKTPYGDDIRADVVLAEEKRGGVTYYNPILPRDILHGKTLVVLVNGGSASASEITSGVLQLRGRAVIAGVEKTFGKGSVQTVIPLTGHGAMRLTTAQYLIGPVGCPKAVQDIGITPDIWLKPKEGERLVENHERDFANALATSSASSTDCKYHFTLSSERLKEAREMLKVFGFEEKEPKAN